MAKAAPQSPALFGEGEIGETPDNVSRAAFDAWNEHAQRHGWPKAQHNTAGRPAKLRRSVKDVGGLAAWRALLEKCGKSDFLCGRAQSAGRKPFVLTLDWIVKPANLLKCMEGNYWPGSEPTVSASIARQSAPTDTWGRWLRDYKLKAFWPPHLGPRPEEEGCRAPAPMIEACLKRLGITVQARPVETREQRMASVIVSYRRIGRYEDANRVERELAAIEGRPAVEVPAPDARNPDVVPPLSPKPTANYARKYSSPPHVTDIVEEYEAVPEGDPDLYEDA